MRALIKAVFFDFDGVLTTDKTGSLTTARYLSQATGLALHGVKAVFARYNNDLTMGRTTHAKIWESVCHDLGRELPINLLHEAFESTPMNAGMFSLARQLGANYAVGIITDNKKDRIDHLKATHKLAALFDPIVVSSEIGANKKGKEIFVYALSSASVRPEESVFIDNNRENLVAPDALGIKTVFHDDETNDIAALVEKLNTLGVAGINA